MLLTKRHWLEVGLAPKRRGPIPGHAHEPPEGWSGTEGAVRKNLLRTVPRAVD